MANLRALSDQSISYPCRVLSKKPIVKTATAHVINVFHTSSNFQTGFPLESSYINNAPPIGAPKATLTPADAPAHIRFRLSVWLLRKFKSGIYVTTAEPKLAPI